MKKNIEHNNGGPAFPCVDYLQPADGVGVSVMTITGGMSLRDWFAGMTLSGFAANPEFYKWTAEECATDAYEYADTMLAARDKLTK